MLHHTSESLVKLLASLPAHRRRAWTRRYLQDTAMRELVETAAELTASPQPHESSQLCSVIIHRAEPLLAPHTKSLRRAVLWHKYRWAVVSVSIVAVVFAMLSLRKNETTQVTQTNTNQINTTQTDTIQTDTTSVVVVAPVSYTAAEIAELGERRAVLPMLVAFTKGAMDSTLGLSRDELSPKKQQHRDILAAQLDAINLAAAAEAMRHNHLGRAFAIEVAAMREIGLNPETIPPETLPESLAPHDLARRLATDGTAAIITPSLAVQSAAGGETNSGGSGTSDGAGSGAVSTDTKPSKPWSELPTREETLRQRSELPLLPAAYWNAVQRYLEKL